MKVKEFIDILNHFDPYELPEVFLDFRDSINKEDLEKNLRFGLQGASAWYELQLKMQTKAYLALSCKMDVITKIT